MLTGTRKVLIDQASHFHRIRNPSGDLILDIDSTTHIQHGKKMEGLRVNYAGENSLESIEVFDQFGFCYHLEVREGATFTAQGAPDIISGLARMLKDPFRYHHRYIRADSGYCNNQVFDACDKGGFDFVISLRENLQGGLFRKRHDWKKARSEGLSREGVEFSENLYHSKQNGKFYRAVLMRKPVEGPRPLFEEAKWEYFGWITSVSSSEMSGEEIVLFYRGRGHAENFIRELKYGFDLKHFPCQKLDANRAYGLIAAFAHNLMRFVSLAHFPKVPAFSKKIRCISLDKRLHAARPA